MMKNELKKNNLITLLMFALLIVFSTSDSHAGTFVMPNPSENPAAQRSAEGKPVIFAVASDAIAANVYYPTRFSEDKKYPAVIVVTPQDGLKEQTASTYALILSKQVFLTIAFDHPTYDQSAGAPLNYESPQCKAEDIKGVVSYTSTLRGVDQEHLSVLAIYSGAGYGVLASIRDDRIKALATVSGAFNFHEHESGLKGISKPTPEELERYRTKMAISAKARQKHFETGVMNYPHLVPELTPQSNVFWRQGYEHYVTERRFINGWGQESSAHSMEARLSINTSFLLPQLFAPETPFLAIAGDKTFTYLFNVTAIERAQGKKQLYAMKGATHFNLYDNDKYVNEAVATLKW